MPKKSGLEDSFGSKKLHKIQFYTSNNFFTKNDRNQAARISKKKGGVGVYGGGDQYGPGLTRNVQKHYLNTENLIKEESSEEN